MGHSFFVPIAGRFDAFAKVKNQRDHSYPNHDMQTFFQGGEKGSPLYLWDNHKEEIETVLSAGDIELFGMTAAPSDEDLDAGTVLAGYTQWIDLALTYNPDTAFLIGLPWSDYPAYYDDSATYKSTNQENGELVFRGVALLRRRYPDNHIYFLNYGIIAAEMKSMFEGGALVDISAETGTNEDTSIFIDQKGHAGSMLKDLAGLFWMHWLYDASMDTLLIGVKFLGWDEQNALDIFLAADQENQDYLLVASTP